MTCEQKGNGIDDHESVCATSVDDVMCPPHTDSDSFASTAGTQHEWKCAVAFSDESATDRQTQADKDRG